MVLRLGQFLTAATSQGLESSIQVGQWRLGKLLHVIGVVVYGPALRLIRLKAGPSVLACEVQFRPSSARTGSKRED